MTHTPRIFRVEMTRLEANAVVRLIAIANTPENEHRNTSADASAGTWVAKRIIAMIEADSTDPVSTAQSIRETKPKRGSVQTDVLRSLKQHGYWFKGAGWLWDTPGNTYRIMQALVKRGEATVELRNDGKVEYFQPVA